MVSFEDVFWLIIRLETGGRDDGAYHNDPHDPGGETKWGITKRSYPHLNIKDLSLMDAHLIYKRDFWDAAGCGDIIPMRARLAVFDCAVNQGVRVAKILWRRSQRWGSEAPEVFMAYRALRYMATRGFARYGLGWMKRLFIVAKEMGRL